MSYFLDVLLGFKKRFQFQFSLANLSQKKYVFIIIAGAVIIVISVGIILIFKPWQAKPAKQPKEQSSKSTQASPQTNPFEVKTNPFKDVKTNPFR